MLKKLLTLLLLSLSTASYAQIITPNAQGVVFVDHRKNGTGESWDDAAKDFADVLLRSHTNTAIRQIWVAKGTYKPKHKLVGITGTSSDLDITFTVPRTVSIYGGFDPDNGISNLNVFRLSGDNGTILDGQITSTRKVYHVIVLPTTASNNVIDGFTVINGSGNPSSNVVNSNIGSITYDRRYGAAIYVRSGNVTVNNCIFKHNASGEKGSVISFQGSGTSYMDKCRVHYNTGGYGVVDVLTKSVIKNSLFSNNSSIGQASAINNYQAQIDLINCTIANNSGGAAAVFSEHILGVINMHNTIVWGNAPVDFNNNGDDATAKARYKVHSFYSLRRNNTNISNPSGATDILTTNPGFVNGATGDYNLAANSPAINKGNPSTNTAGHALQVGEADVKYEARIFQDSVDIGAFEAPSNNIITNLPNILREYGDDLTARVSTTTTSGLPVTFSSNNPSVASIIEDASNPGEWFIQMHSYGVATITISQAGNQVYERAVSQTFTVSYNRRMLSLAVNGDPVERSYDGTTNISVPKSKVDLVGVLGNEDVSYTMGATRFADKDVGVDKHIIIDGFSIGGAAVANYRLFSSTATITGTITPRVLTITPRFTTAVTKVYDGQTTTGLTASQFVLSGALTGESVNLQSLAIAYVDKNSGTDIALTVDSYGLGGSANTANYVLNFNSINKSGTITPKPLTVSVGAIGKVYDGTAAVVADTASYILGGVVGTEEVHVVGVDGSYTDKNAGTNKAVTLNNITLGGADLANYSFAFSPMVTYGNITTAVVSVSLQPGNTLTKVYNGYANFTLGDNVLRKVGVIAGDDLSVSYLGSFTDKNAGVNKALNPGGFILLGVDAMNYSAISDGMPLTGTITPQPLTLRLKTVFNKTYDGSATAALTESHFNLLGLVSGEAVGFSFTDASFANKNVGNDKTIAINGVTLTGAGASNYTIAPSTSGFGNISKKTISVSVNGILSKVYDGTTAVVVDAANYTLTGLVGTDDVHVGGVVGRYADKNAGIDKEIDLQRITLAGTDFANYGFSFVSTRTIGAITRKALTASLNTAATFTKVYNGTSDLTLTSEQYILDGLVGNDMVTAYVLGKFDDANVGTGKQVRITTLHIPSGVEPINYEPFLNSSITATGSITAKTLTLALKTNISKVYNRSAAAGLTTSDFNLIGGVGGEAIGFTFTDASYADKNVGTDKALTVSGITLTGAAAGNYSLGPSLIGVGSITPRTLTISFGNINKTYDGTVNLPNVVHQLQNFFTADDVRVESITGSYNSKSAGIQTINISDVSLTGADLANYSFVFSPTSANGYIYMATVYAILKPGFIPTSVYGDSGTILIDDDAFIKIGVLAGDVLGVSSSVTFTDRSVGENKPFNIDSYTLFGADARNYVIDGTGILRSGRITPKPLTLALKTYPAINKIYDGNAVAELTASNFNLNGVLGGESVSFTWTNASYADKNVGSGKPITVNGIILTGAQAGNYTIAPSTSGLGVIHQRVVAVTINPNASFSKVYDGNNAISLTDAQYHLTGLISSDGLSVNVNAAFDDANVGTSKSVSITGLTLTGSERINYGMSYDVTPALGSITPKALTLVLNSSPAISKVYDGDSRATLAAANYSFNGVVGADDVRCTTTSISYDNANAGVDKVITVAGIALAGSKSGNYSLAVSSATTTGTITVKPLLVSIKNTPLVTKVYDGTTTAPITKDNFDFVGIASSDVLDLGAYISAYSDKNVGDGKPISVRGLSIIGAHASNYQLSATSFTTTGNITAKPITVGLNQTISISKVYDGTRDAVLSENHFMLDGLVSGDDITYASSTASYDNKNAGRSKMVSISHLVFGGADRGNYLLTTPSDVATGVIEEKPLTIELAAGYSPTKVYDGNTVAIIAPAPYVLDAVVGDNLVVSHSSASYTDKHVGTNKTINILGIGVTGTDASNYSLTTTSLVTSGSITHKPLTFAVRNSPVVTKVYDGDALAPVVAGQFVFTGVVPGDDVSYLSADAFYADKNAGSDKEVTVSHLLLSGADHLNYNVSTASVTLLGHITTKPLTLSVSANPTITKVYDGSTEVRIPAEQFTLSGVVGRDNVSFSRIGDNYVDATVGTNKLITVSGIALNGSDSFNYNLPTISLSTTGHITAKPLTLTLNNSPVLTKVYDGSTAANIPVGQFTFDGVLNNEAVGFDWASATYDNKNVGTNKSITVAGIYLTGAAMGNYSLAVTNLSTTGHVTAKPLTLALNNSPALSKVYDGDVAANIPVRQFTFDGVLNNDAVGFEWASATYDNKNVGTNKNITVAGIYLTGAAMGNYSLAVTNLSTTGHITAKPLSLALNSSPMVNKVYDGHTVANISGRQFTFDGVLNNEAVGFDWASATYDNKNVGTNKDITVAGIYLTGAAMGNYSLAVTNLSTTGHITAKPLSLALNNSPVLSKVYDGDVAANISVGQFTFDGVLNNEAVGIDWASAAYDNKNVGTNKDITVTGIYLTGAAMGNYSLAVTSLSTTGHVTAKPLTLALNNSPVISKVYDGNAVATLATSQFDLSGIMGNDAVGLSFTNALYNDQHVGTDKAISITGIAIAGDDKGNYSLAINNLSTTGHITAKPLTVSLNASPLISKNHDGTTAATLVADNYRVDGVLPSDVVNVVATATYDSAAKGAAKVVTANNFVLTGSSAHNYAMSHSSAATTGTILGLIPSLTWATPADMIYGTPLSSTTLNAVANIAGSYSYSSDFGVVLGAGTNELRVVFTPADLTTYDSVDAAVRLTVLKKELSVSANAIERCFQSDNPPLTYTITGFVNGETARVLHTAPSLSTTAIYNSAVGSYPILIDGAQADNYSFSYTNGSLTVNALPVAVLTATPANLTIEHGESIALRASGGQSYVWRDALTSAVLANGANVLLQPELTTKMILEVTNSSGCTTSTMFTVTVTQTVSAANIFSPNGDGVHDVWVIKHIATHPNAVVQIFDMSGVVVFKSKGYARAFDGTYKGQPLKNGVYYYVINLNDGSKALTGSLTIIR